jgi:hypothetical protein
MFTFTAASLVSHVPSVGVQGTCTKLIKLMSRMSHSWVNSFRDQRTQMHSAPDVRMDSNAAGPDSAQVKYAEPGR